jgi:hypothetical protein
MSNKTNDQYFEMINELIEEDKQNAEADNIETAILCRNAGYEVACTVCGDPKCEGDYWHWSHFGN